MIRGRLILDERGKCINAFETLSDPNILRSAYETIKSKSGNMVEGTDKEDLRRYHRGMI